MSGQTEIGSADVANDRLIIWDATDSALKKIAPNDLGIGGGGISFDGSTANGVLTYKDSDEATVESNLTFDGTDLSITGKVKTTGLEFTDGDEAITIEDGGYLKFNSGVRYSPSV